MAAPVLTKNQKLVYAGLVRAGRAMSAYDLLDELRGQGLRAPVQVYRALEKLADERSPAKAEEPRRAQPRRPR